MSFEMNEYSLNVPLFDGSLFIQMRKNNDNYQNGRNTYVGKRQRVRKRQRRGRDWNAYNQAAASTSNDFNSMRHNESEQNHQFPSLPVFNPFAKAASEISLKVHKISTQIPIKRQRSKYTIQQFSQMAQPIVLVHGGAGDIPDNRVGGKMRGVKLAAATGFRILSQGGTVVDAVEAAVVSMENDEAFNAGYGSVLNLDEEVEMEASIQQGSDLNAGCVTLVKDIKNPIRLARKVMEECPHVMLGGEGARRFAVKQGFDLVDPQSLVTDSAREALKKMLEKGGDGGSELGQSKGETGVGTVGAVAIDDLGHIAVATSTGGRTGKYVGRIGDTPQIGSGTYADDKLGGVSTTGHGESILKVCLAYNIVKRIKAGFTAQDATEMALESMTERLKQTAGAITISHRGDLGIYFTSQRMAWCYIKGTKIHFGIEQNQHHQCDFNLEENQQAQPES